MLECNISTNLSESRKRDVVHNVTSGWKEARDMIFLDPAEIILWVCLCISVANKKVASRVINGQQNKSSGDLMFLNGGHFVAFTVRS